MKKHFKKFGKENYFLGTGKDGENYYLQSASWDCDWYWGFGYVETFTNKRNPELSRDINSHQHFNSLFFGKKCGYDAFKEFFVSTPLTDKEILELCELMKTFYIMREYSDTLSRGGAHYTSNPCRYLIKNDAEYERINKVVLPEIFKNIYEILS